MGLLFVPHDLPHGIVFVFPTLNFRGFFITKHSEDPGESWKDSGRGSGKVSGRGSGSPEWSVPDLCQNLNFVKRS